MSRTVSRWKFEIDPHRGTGRTTRTILAAISKFTEPGRKYIVVVARTDDEARRHRTLASEILQLTGFEGYHCAHEIKCDVRRMQFCGAEEYARLRHRPDFTFVDHSAEGLTEYSPGLVKALVETGQELRGRIDRSVEGGGFLPAITYGPDGKPL